MFRLKLSAAAASVLALVMALAVPTQPALSAGSVTKTVVVTDSNGDPYEGVTVAMISYSDTAQANTVESGHSATTDASGTASILVPDVPTSGAFQGLAVQPAEGDNSHGAYLMFPNFIPDDESFEVQLDAADLLVEVVQPDGSATPAGTSVIIYDKDGNFAHYVSATRSGVIPLSLGELNQANAPFELNVNSSPLPNTYQKAYTLNFDGGNPVVSDGGSVLSPTSGVYELPLLAPNIQGELQLSGSAYSLPSGVSAKVLFAKLDGGQDRPPFGSASADGSFTGLANEGAGEYEVLVFFEGSETIPNQHTGVTFFVNDQGQISPDDSAYVNAENFQLVVPISLEANFSMETSGYGAYIDVWANSGPATWNGPNWSATGVTAWNLADGDYQMWVTPTNRLNNFGFFEVSVSSGTVSVSQDGQEVNPISGHHYSLNGSQPNLFVYGVSETSGKYQSNLSSNLIENNQWLRGFYGFNGKVGIEIPTAGTYELELQSESSEVVTTRFTVIATGPDDSLSFEIRDENDSLITGSGSTYVLSMTEPNVALTVLDSSGNAFEGGELRAELQVLNEGYWTQESWLSASGNLISAKVSDTSAQYRIIVAPFGDPNSAIGIKEFTITNDQINGTLLELSLQLPAPNFSFQTTWEDQIVGDVGGELRDSNDQAFSLSNDWDGNPVGLSLADGTYSLRLDPNQIEGASRTTFTVVVASSVATIEGLTAVDGVFQLPISAGNVRVKVINPLDDQLFSGEAQATIYRVDGQNRQHVSDGWTRTGLISLAADSGTYSIEVSHFSDNYRLVKKSYDLIVGDDTSNVTITDPSNSDTEIASNDDGTFSLPLGTANTYGRVMLSADTPLATSWQDRKWANVILQTQNEWGDWQWSDVWTQTNSDGYFAFDIEQANDYRLMIEPEGYPDVAKTTFEFTVDAGDLATLDLDLGQILMSSPLFSVSVINPNTDAVVTRAGVEIRTENSFIDWFDTGANGTAGITISEAGTYTLSVHPSGDGSSPGTSRRSYELTISGTPGSFTYSIAGQTATNGTFELPLAVPTLSGVVYDPTGNAPVRDAQVVPVDVATGQGLWEYSSNTNYLGQWSMALPEGSYELYARAPWGSVLYGEGARSAQVEVDSNGVATVSEGSSAGEFDLFLSAPTWSGTVVEPGGTNLLPGTQICLVYGESEQWYCTDANDDGEWALSAPSGFTGIDSSTRLHVREWRTRQYAEKQIVGSDLEALFGTYVSGQTYTDITLSPAAPNLEIQVTAAGNPVSRVWVNVDRDNFGWLGGGETDNNGIARIFVDDPWTDVNVQVDVREDSDVAGQFASTRKTFAADSGGDTRSISVALSAPNFTGFVTTPDGDPVQYSWVDSQNLDTHEWIGGSNSARNGAFSLLLPEPDSGTLTYKVNVNPSWSGSGTWARNTYQVVVTAGAGVTSVADGGGNGIFAIDGNYTLKLASPSVTGVVQDSDGNAVRDSWIVPLDNSSPAFPQYRHDYSSNSRSGGSFNMALPDGAYLLEANPPWNSSGSAKSARCDITVSGGAITTGNADCWEDQAGVTLTLRAPNVRFTLTDGTDPVPFANVGVGFGSWHTWVQSDRDGNVALFIDAEEIVTLNPGLDSTDTLAVRFWFDPPFGNSDIVRWECEAGDLEPICEDIPLITVGDASNYLASPLELGSAAFPEPNTKVRVLDPNGDPVGAGAWVGLMVNPSDDGCDHCRYWLSGGQTDEMGYAAFNVDDAYLTDGSRFFLDVNAPWNERQTYAPVQYEDLVYADVDNQEFALALPNLQVTLFQYGNSQAARWSWIGAEEVDPITLQNIAWVGGSGVDDQGRASMSLGPEKTFRLTAHPGSGMIGVRTSCLVETDASSVVSAVTDGCPFGVFDGANLTLTLSGGNVSGTVTYNSGAGNVAGAIVYAEADGYESVSTVTNPNGAYSLQLDGNATWTLKVFVVSRPGDAVQLLSNTSAGSIANPGNSETVDLEALVG